MFILFDARGSQCSLEIYLVEALTNRLILRMVFNIKLLKKKTKKNLEAKEQEQFGYLAAVSFYSSFM